MKRILLIFIAAVFVISLAGNDLLAEQNRNKPDLSSPAERNDRIQIKLMDEVRHQLLTLPYYGIFDWLEATVEPDGKVILRGQAVRPMTKSDAESRVKKLEGVTGVSNQIEVLPLSTFDDESRVAIYRRLVREAGLEKYFLQAVPPIHIIVQGGHVTLKGVVASTMDSQLAYMAASGVPNVFDVKNELGVEKQ